MAYKVFIIDDLNRLSTEFAEMHYDILKFLSSLDPCYITIIYQLISGSVFLTKIN